MSIHTFCLALTWLRSKLVHSQQTPSLPLTPPSPSFCVAFPPSSSLSYSILSIPLHRYKPQQVGYVFKQASCSCGVHLDLYHQSYSRSVLSVLPAIAPSFNIREIIARNVRVLFSRCQPFFDSSSRSGTVVRTFGLTESSPESFLFPYLFLLSSSSVYLPLGSTTTLIQATLTARGSHRRKTRSPSLVLSERVIPTGLAFVHHS